MKKVPLTLLLTGIANSSLADISQRTLTVFFCNIELVMAQPEEKNDKNSKKTLYQKASMKTAGALTSLQASSSEASKTAIANYINTAVNQLDKGTYKHFFSLKQAD